MISRFGPDDSGCAFRVASALGPVALANVEPVTDAFLWLRPRAGCVVTVVREPAEGDWLADVVDGRGCLGRAYRLWLEEVDSET